MVKTVGIRVSPDHGKLLSLGPLWRANQAAKALLSEHVRRGPVGGDGTFRGRPEFEGQGAGRGTRRFPRPTFS